MIVADYKPVKPFNINDYMTLIESIYTETAGALCLYMYAFHKQKETFPATAFSTVGLLMQ